MNSIVEQLQHYFQLPLRSPILIVALILFIILLVPMLVERLRIPGIIGLIASGILIGPNGFDVLGKSLFVDVFSTIGLLYIMFLAGLELNLVEFKANRNKSFVFAFLTFTLPLGIGFPVCHYLLGMGAEASLLVASIFATHTLVTYPIAGRFEVTGDPSVPVAVGGTIITDTAVLLVLALILGSHSGGITNEFWMRMGVSLTAFSAFMFLVVPRVAGWFFQQLEGRKYSHYVFVMAIMFLSAFLAELAGLEGIIGAFAAGIALNRAIPASSPLMNRTEFIGNSLFIPFFLISVGMVVDVGVIASDSMTIVMAIAMTITAVFGKYAAAWTTQRVFQFSRDQRQLLFGLSTAHAAATLAVVMVGYREGIVGDDVLNGIVMIILASCIVASLVTERAARSLASSSSSRPAAAVTRDLEMEQILVPVSDPSRAEQLLQLATLIKDRSSTHPLVMLNVVPNSEQAEAEIAEVRNALEGVTSEAAAAEVQVRVIATIARDPAYGIARTAIEVAADLIILNLPRSQDALRKLVSEGPDSVLRHTRKTVFLCNFQRAMVKHSGLFAIVPPLAELEEGFAVWADKLIRLATELSLPLRLNCTEGTRYAISLLAKERKATIDLEFDEFADWEDFFIVSRQLQDSDLIVLVLARRGAVSFNDHLQRLPAKLERHFPESSKILIYPQ